MFIKKSRDKLVVFVSDLHSNSTVALCPPTVQLEDGGMYVCNIIQAWLWKEWIGFWDLVKTMRRGKKLIIVWVGDLTENQHHGTIQIVSPSRIVEHEITLLNLEPAMDCDPDESYFLRGTEAHVGASAEFENFIAKETNAIKDAMTGSYTWSWLPLDVNGTLFNIAHHASGGGLPWTGPNSATKMAAIETIYAAEAGERLPDIVIRAHKHEPKDSYDNRKVRVLTLPPWQLNTMLGTRLSPGKVTPVGGYVFNCKEQGGYELTKYIRRPKRRAPIKT